MNITQDAPRKFYLAGFLHLTFRQFCGVVGQFDFPGRIRFMDEASSDPVYPLFDGFSFDPDGDAYQIAHKVRRDLFF
jgi:hypothetical protein